MEYIRLSEGVKNYQLIPTTDDIWDYIQTTEKDYYQSIYKYTEDHYRIWKEKKSVRGITDVKTDKLVFDFDSEDNIEKAQKDTLTLVKRLKDLNVQEDAIRLSFSGNKGFCVEVHLESDITPKDFKTGVMNLAGDLETFDKVVYDPNRILRVIGTKNLKSGLYKIPLTLEQLNTSCEAIKKAASDLTEEQVSITRKWTKTKLPKKVFETVKKEESAPVTVAQAIDLSNKPKWMIDSKFALQEGYFLPGERNSAFMILAATYRSQGFNEELAFRLLQGVADIQSKRNKQERFTDQEIKSNILSVVYSDGWQGGTYSYEATPLLQEVTKRLGLKPPKEDGIAPKHITNITDRFKTYINNLDKNSIKTGIKTLDDNLFMTTGMNIGVLGAPGSGKCLGYNTPIIMFDGSVKMVQDVEVGDLLMGDDSCPRTVLSTCTGKEMLYKIKQKNGDDYVVNESHILSLKGSSNKTTFKYGKVFDINVLDYLKTNANFKKRVKGYKVAVEFGKKDLEIDPYIFGAWLGDGTTSKTDLTISKKDVELLNRLQDWAKNNLLNIRFNQYASSAPSVYTVTFTGEVNKFRNFLKNYDLFSGKYIPKHYLTGSRHQRLELLAGILDTDGHYEKEKDVFSLTCSNDRLSDDILFLIRSLGFKVTRTKKLAKYNSVTRGVRYKGESWTNVFYITGKNLYDIPTILPRKKAKKVNKQRYQDLTEISVEPIGIGNYYGFEIDGNKRFLLGDFTVTHNTSLSLEILNNTSKAGIKSVFASLDMTATRIYEKLAYRLTGKSRAELYDMFKEGNEEEYTKLLQQEFGNVYFFDKTMPTVDDLRNYILACQEHSGEKIKLVLVDYFERLYTDINEDTAASKKLAGQLQDLVNDLDICLVTLVQPNKMSGDLSTPIYSYTNIKGSSFLAQSFRMILGVYREGFDPRVPEQDRFLTVNVLKNDLGEVSSYDFSWNGKRGEISELPDDEKFALAGIRKHKDLMKNGDL